MINSLSLGTLGLVGILITGSIFLLIWNKPVLVIYVQFGYCCFMRFLVSVLHFPDFIKYFSDFLTIVLFVQVVLQFNKAKSLNIRKPMFFIVLFIITTVLSVTFNGASLIFFLWGIRVYLRFFVFFIACTVFLKRKDIDNLFNFLLKLLPVNTFIVFFQYFVLKYEDDYIGGLFGNEQGCNGEMNIFLIVLIIIAIVYYIINKINLKYLLIILLQIFLTAALSELKVIFVIVPMVILIFFVLYFPNKRMIKLVLFCIPILVFTIVIFFTLYPEWLKLLQSFSYFYENMTVGYAGGNTLGRFESGPYALYNLLNDSTQRLFGIGFGNASKFLSFESPFYQRYSKLNFHFFSYAQIIIEIGLIGLIVYCLFFITILYESFRIKKLLKIDCIFYCYISFIASILVFPLLIYNITMQVDAAFIIFFTLSLPFIMEKEVHENNIEKTDHMNKGLLSKGF